ncbi:hypothetical protein RRG08_040861, partial [Elysia crispata]
RSTDEPTRFLQVWITQHKRFLVNTARRDEKFEFFDQTSTEED